MTTITVEFPATLLVDLKDFPQQSVSTEKFDAQYVKNAVLWALRKKLEQARNSGGNEITDAKRRDQIEAARKALEEEFQLRAGSAAKLTEDEEEFRLMLAGHFEKAGVKKSEALKLARETNRLQNFRDLVVKKKYQELGEERTAAEIDEKARQLFFQLKQAADRRAEAIRKSREEMQIDF